MAEDKYQKNCLAVGRDIESIYSRAYYSRSKWLKVLLPKARDITFTAKQLVVIGNELEKLDRYEAEREAMALSLPKAAEGRYVIVGTVVGFKEKEYYYTYNFKSVALKMMIQTLEGQKMFGTVPSNIQPKVGDVVSFTATVHPREPGFSYFSRPVKGVVRQMGEQSQRLHDAMNPKNILDKESV